MNSIKWAVDLDRSRRTLPGSIIGYRKNGAPIRLQAGGAATNVAPASTGGYGTQGDVVGRLADGTDLNDLWAEFQATLSAFNAHRQTLVDFLTFPVQREIETIPQGTTVNFESASEFGVPQGVQTKISYWQLGYDFNWYDIATRYTWKFLLDADARQVETIHQQVLEGDNRNVFNKVMNAIFRNTNRTASITGQNYTVYSLYNGTDGTVPPTYKTNTFTSGHTHYQASGAATIDSGDLEALIDDLSSHGFGPSEGTTIIMLVNKAQADVIRTFRMGQTNNNSAVAKYDFVPSNLAPPLILPNALLGAGLLGSQPPSSINGMPVLGSYANALIVQEDYIPAGYVVAFATGGTAALQNPVGFREHANPNARGLQLLPGNQAGYPLQDSFYRRGFGTGIRQRGSAIVMQITAGSYSIPTQYA